jgi:colanic acid/amylovoran biosynthesis glycosyltransferase
MRTSCLRVLAYHRILPDTTEPPPAPTLVSATPGVFERQMALLARRYCVVSLDDVLSAQRGLRPLPPRAVLLTFDDGYRDFGDIAWPVLRRHGFPAAVFVATDYPGQAKRVFWWDRLHHALRTTAEGEVHVPLLGTLPIASASDRLRSQRLLQSHIKTIPHADVDALVDGIVAALSPDFLPESEVHDWPELRQLAAEGVAVVAHTRSHAALTRLSAAAAGDEIAGSLAAVQRGIGSAAPVVCYPFGLHDTAVVREAALCGVELAFTCMDGHNVLPSPSPLRLRRTVITRRTSPLVFGLRLTRTMSYIDVWRHAGGRDAEAGTPPTPDDAGQPPTADDADVPPALHEAAQPPALRVAYIMSRFPKLSETFVLNEMAALDARGVDVSVYPLLRERQHVQHAEAEAWTRRARFHGFLSLSIVAAIVHFLRRRPRALLAVVVEVLRGTAGSLNFFLGALGIFPKSVRFAYEMQRSGVQHVHAHFATHPAVAALIVHRLTGIPFSFTAHGSDLHVDRCMLAAKVEAAAFAVTVSGFNRQIMIRECGAALADRIHVVHCGVDPASFAPSAATRGGGPFTLVCVASLEEVKGHRFLIDACSVLRERGIDVRCELIGEGPLRPAVRRQISELGLGDHVRMLGGLPRSEVARHLARADAAVLASHPTRQGRREGIPVALMEAMATGLPVVATAISGIPELVEDGVTGLLVPSGDAAGLADALERLATDPALRGRLGAAARLKVMQEFDLEDNAARLLDLIVAHRRPDRLVAAS